MTTPKRPRPGPPRPGPGGGAAPVPAATGPVGTGPAGASTVGTQTSDVQETGSFAGLDQRPVAEHVAVFEAEHARLQRELGTIDQL